MAADKTTFKFNAAELRNAYKLMDALDLKTKSQILRGIHRKALTPLKPLIINAAPKDRIGRLKNGANFSFQSSPTNKSGIIAGYNGRAFIARFIEKGTKTRTKGHNRGKINARPWIEQTYSSYIPTLLKYLEDNYAKLILTNLKRINKSLSKKLSKK